MLRQIYQASLSDEVTLQLIRAASPISHVRSELASFLLVHSTGDMSVWYNWSPQVQGKLKAAGGACNQITIPDGLPGMAHC
jgi:dipeptidyl aminopeptidase/acylaminoacyl peptidase